MGVFAVFQGMFRPLLDFQAFVQIQRVLLQELYRA